jgi:hypothetical protein
MPARLTQVAAPKTLQQTDSQPLISGRFAPDAITLWGDEPQFYETCSGLLGRPPSLAIHLEQKMSVAPPACRA